MRFIRVAGEDFAAIDAGEWCVPAASAVFLGGFLGDGVAAGLFGGGGGLVCGVPWWCWGGVGWRNVQSRHAREQCVAMQL